MDIDIILETFKQGKGVWKFTCSLLTHPDYLKLSNDAIMTVKKQYAAPVYDLENLASVPDTDINFSMRDDVFEYTKLKHLLKMRGDTIKYASKLKRAISAREQALCQLTVYFEFQSRSDRRKGHKSCALEMVFRRKVTR